MSVQNNLEQITRSLTDIQRDCEVILKEEIDDTDNAMDNLQLKDIYKIIESDIKCRINLEVVENIIPKISFTDEAYNTFIEYSNKIVEYLEQYDLPNSIEEAFKTVRNALTISQLFTLQEVFTIISVLITTVALCLTKIDHETLKNIINMLDTLLSTKERQLNLIIQMTKWRSEYIN